ncbi:hypothetical protein [Corallococcus sicarius]|uniref:Uncharacterized protein n=1 Tax=Corallococcus sicarius TaxID=2316726 RepID=A0A3A8P6W2_9BACT|nr:hypothetical protein [Corallococcus sicarius]RKH48152.1 hypothetical protein D7X12_00795 [Corallococcus sicarius]
MEPVTSAQSSSSNTNDLFREIGETEKRVSTFFANPWKVPWLKKKDPELVKAFSRVSSRLVELRVYLELGAAIYRPPQPVLAITSVLQRITDKLGRDAAWDAAEELKIALLYFAPDAHLSSLLEGEAELKGFQEQRAATEKTGEALPARGREVIIDRLASLYQQRMDSWRHDRANEQLRANYFFAVTAVLGVVLGLAGVMTVWEGKPFACPVNTFLLTAMAAGALGSVLGGVYTLRDEIMSIRQLRAFWPVLTAQPFVGATAAMLLFAVLTSGLIKVANLDVESFTWQHHTVFGFLAGFSEPFFLGVVKRVAGLADEKKAPPKAPRPPKDAATPESPMAKPDR